MASRTAQCANCKDIFAVRIMRYVKQADGTWAYLCNTCRVKHGIPNAVGK